MTMSRPFRAENNVALRSPRALPWAGMSCPFRAVHGCFRVLSAGDTSILGALSAIIQIPLPDKLDTPSGMRAPEGRNITAQGNALGERNQVSH